MALPAECSCVGETWGLETATLVPIQWSIQQMMRERSYRTNLVSMRVQQLLEALVLLILEADIRWVMRDSIGLSLCLINSSLFQDAAYHAHHQPEGIGINKVK